MRVPLVGEQLGRYEIVRALGSGAMGEVYAAYDERLDREVALKVLRPQFAEDFQRRERFEREAKAIAALDHPNIVTIYSVEEADGSHFITMQLIEGKTLDQVIPEGGMPVETLLGIALRLVEAVAAAHQKGIVHRDLKPSNVMVTGDGRLKVLDFGLAKLRSETSHLQSLSGESIGLTLEGQIVGTVAYMSPEQAEGRPADHRSDIFSLGVLMFEMATGKAPFIGETPISVMSSIIKDTPSLVTELRAGVPPHLARIIRTCLAKDPVRRYQSAIDLRNALDDLKGEVQSGEFEHLEAAAAPIDGPVAAPRPHPARAFGWPALALVALAAGWLLGRSLAPAGGDGLAEPGSRDLQRMTSQAGLAGSPSWSPDGSDIVYASDVAGGMDLWHLERDGRIDRITDFPGEETDPNWAPDGSSVAYTRDFGNGGIAIISPHGGQPTSLTGFGARPRWSPDSTRIVFDWRGDLYVTAARHDAAPSVVVEDTSGVPHAVWSRDGRSIYYWNRSLADVYMVGADGSLHEPLGLVPAGQEVAGLAVDSAGRFLIVSRGPYGGNKDLWRVDLDARGRPAGALARLTWPTTDDVEPALSPDGARLAFAARHVVRHLWSMQIDPENGQATGVYNQLTSAADSNYYPSLSADGLEVVWTAHRTSVQGLLYTMRLDGDFTERKVTTVWEPAVREIGGVFSPAGDGILFTSTASGAYELWRAGCVVDCVPTRLTRAEHPVRDVSPSVASDGRRVVFYANRAGNWDIWSLELGNGAEPRRLTADISHEMYPVFSPSGRQIAYWTNRNDGGGDIWVMDAAGTRQAPLIEDDAQEGWSAWSTDERFFYFASDRSGAFNIWGQATAGGEPFPVTRFRDLKNGLPEAALYTKFAVGAERIIVPVEERTGGIWILEGIH
jgi:Tol biopolymer transport system component/tRNA A-37 threonylcarbamoyl transferase component Bud32